MFVTEVSGLPAGVEEMPPGAELAQVLAGVDRRLLSGKELVVLLRARSRLRAHLDAELYADMAAVAEAVAEELGTDLDLREVQDSAASEIRAALSWTRRAAEYHLDLAHDLTQRLPAVGEALWRGWIDLPRARVIVSETCHLRTDQAEAVATEVLESARALTTGQLRARIHRLAISVDPHSAQERFREGTEQRRVVVEPREDGTASIYGLGLPPHRAQAALGRINRLARSARHPNDSRDIDQVRADVFLDLLCGTGHQQQQQQQAGGGVVDIRVDLTTLAGLDDHPGDLAGFGPVIADIARQVYASQAHSGHRVTVTGESGEVAWAGTTRRRATAGQQRAVEARHPSCVFVGCRMPAGDCDLDHTRPWAQGGPTEEDNLAPLCRHDHRLKHRGGWKLERTGSGTHTWTSPLGHTYTVPAEPP